MLAFTGAPKLPSAQVKVVAEAGALARTMPVAGGSSTQLAARNAAALVATVAGLGVAIPALFAYNWLGSRIKDIDAETHVFGDEFTGPSIQDVVDTVDRINRSDKTGERLVRIHSIGFPIPGQYPQHTSMRYATLMRILSARNGGVFVGLPEGDSNARRSN